MSNPDHNTRMERMKKQMEADAAEDMGEISALRAKALALAAKTQNAAHFAALVQAVVAIDAQYAGEKPSAPTLEDQIGQILRIQGMLSQLGVGGGPAPPAHTPAVQRPPAFHGIVPAKSLDELVAEQQPEMKRPPKRVTNPGEVVYETPVSGADGAGNFKGKTTVSFGGRDI